MNPKKIAILDIGRTHLKVMLVAGEVVLREARKDNRTSGSHTKDDPQYKNYLQFDLQSIEEWLLSTLKEFYGHDPFTAIVTVTHGAAGVLIDDEGPVFAAMCYENVFPAEADAAYDALRPPFSETYSPLLGGGLNFGRQVFFFKEYFPQKFARVKHILMYPQYWTWRLTGKAFNEYTSVGSHTDLWNVSARRYSSLASRLGLSEKNLLSEIRPAYANIGLLQPAMLARIGAARGERIDVFHGIHDSSASFLRHDLRARGRYEVLSTGTWIVIFSSTGTFSRLHEHRDMYANVRVSGEGIACAKFMGGREFEKIVGGFEEFANLDLSFEELSTLSERIIREGLMIRPPLESGQGPFSRIPVGTAALIAKPPSSSSNMGSEDDVDTVCELNDFSPKERYVIASLYLALMSETILDLLGATGTPLIEGPFASNAVFTQAFSGLWNERHPGEVLLSNDPSGTVFSAATLTQWESAPARLQKQSLAEAKLTALQPRPLAGLNAYAKTWRALVSPMLK